MKHRNGKLPFIYWPQIYYKVWPIGLIILLFGGFAADSGEFISSFKIFSICIFLYLGFGILLYLYRFINNLVWLYRDGKKTDFYLFLAALGAIFITFGIILASATK